jgi:DNA-binding Xre family transcriptional regulator
MLRLKIDYWMQQRGLSQGKLSRLAGIDEKTLQRALRDPFINISVHTLDKLATALNVHPGELMDWHPGDDPFPTEE